MMPLLHSPGSIPLDAVIVGGAFVVFKILEQGGFHRYMKIIRLIGPYRHERCRHREAMKVARYGAVHIG